MEDKYKKILNLVVEELSHNKYFVQHSIRVYQICLFLAKYENVVDLEILKISALLHDIAMMKEIQDESGTIDHAILGAKRAVQILKSMNYNEDKISLIKHSILTHKFRSKNEPKTKEAKILYDADKLDSIGAIGIARAFIDVGQYNGEIYLKNNLDKDLIQKITKSKGNIALNPDYKYIPNLKFEFKLQYIPERLHSYIAKEIAKKKIAFMKDFFSRLKRESKGDFIIS